jgi:hypothetical protein
MTKENGLDFRAIIDIENCNAISIEEAPLRNLHIITHRGTYKDKPVEIKEFIGGPEDILLKVYTFNQYFRTHTDSILDREGTCPTF